MDNSNIENPSEEAEVKTKPKSKSSKKSALDFKKYTQQIWLAGKLFDSLVKVGEELESKTVDFADNTVVKVTEKAKESVTDTKDKVEKILDTGVNHSLNRIGLVTPKDLQHIEQLLVQLHIKVDALIEENHQLKAKLNKK